MPSIARSFTFRIAGFNISNLIMGMLLFGLGMVFARGGSSFHSINQSSVIEVLQLFGVSVASIVLTILGWKYEDRPFLGKKNILAKFFLVAGPISALYFGSRPFFRDDIRHEACVIAAALIALAISLSFKKSKPLIRSKEQPMVHTEPVAA